MPYIRTIMIASDKLRCEQLHAAMLSEDPVEWIKVIKTDYVRRNDKKARRLPTEDETQIALQAKARLYTMLSSALGIDQGHIEDFIVKHIASTF